MKYLSLLTYIYIKTSVSSNSIPFSEFIAFHCIQKVHNWKIQSSWVFHSFRNKTILKRVGGKKPKQNKVIIIQKNNHNYPKLSCIRQVKLHGVQQSYMPLHCFRMQSGLLNTPHSSPFLILHFALVTWKQTVRNALHSNVYLMTVDLF